MDVNSSIPVNTMLTRKTAPELQTNTTREGVNIAAISTPGDGISRRIMPLTALILSFVSAIMATITIILVTMAFRRMKKYNDKTEPTYLTPVAETLLLRCTVINVSPI